MGFLEQVSPWWWVALAILLAAAEMVTITTVLIWAALAALITALALWLVPGLGVFEQIGLFAALSIVFFFVGRSLVGRFGQPGGNDASTLNRRAAQLVGREAVVTSFERRCGQGDGGRRAVAGAARAGSRHAGGGGPGSGGGGGGHRGPGASNLNEARQTASSAGFSRSERPNGERRASCGALHWIEEQVPGRKASGIGMEAAWLRRLARVTASGERPQRPTA